MTTATDKAAALKQALRSRGGQPPLSYDNAISSGSTLLNLACSDRPDVAFARGGYYFFVGDSAAGKTWLSFCLFAEACRNPAFSEHELIYDDVEGGALMDVERYFGKDVVKRVQQPSRSGCSETVEDFYNNILTRVENRSPFIYVLDSQDALTSVAAKKKLKKQRQVARGESDEKVAGSYGDGKAKYHSEHLRLLLNGMRKAGSILIIIGQTRDNPAAGLFQSSKTRSGGKALKFYNNLEIWLSITGRMTKLVRGHKRTVGTECLAEVRKNRVTGKSGKDRAAPLHILYGLGVDDVGVCVDFLTKWEWQKSKNGVITAPEFEFEGKRKALIQHIEEGNREARLRRLVAKVWRALEDEAEPHRKPRYV